MSSVSRIQIHGVKQQFYSSSIDQLPAIEKLSCRTDFTKSYAFKEFRFEPPYVAKKKEHKATKLPSVPEHTLQRSHDSFDEDDNDAKFCDLVYLPSVLISSTVKMKRHDMLSLSAKATAKSSSSHLFSSREFTFPRTNGKHQKQLPSEPSTVPSFIPRIRNLTLQEKIEKLAKHKREEKKAIERRYAKKLHNLTDKSDIKSHLAFKSRREPNIPHQFHLKEHKYTPFKQMVRIPEESDSPRLHPRVYTRILEGIYKYTKGVHDNNKYIDRVGQHERLTVSPVTVKGEMKSDNIMICSTNVTCNI